MRLNFQQLGAFPPGWAEIHDRRSFDAYFTVREAGREVLAAAPDADRRFALVRIGAYVKEWSLEGSQVDPAFVGVQDYALMQAILDAAVAHYEEVHRSAEERKSDPGGADEGVPGDRATHDA